MRGVDFCIKADRILRRGERKVVMTLGEVNLRQPQLRTQMHGVQPEHLFHVIVRDGIFLAPIFNRRHG